MNDPSPDESSDAVSIRLRDLQRTFPGDVQAIDNISLDIHAGEFVSVLGPSGCGKSTLLRIIAGLDHPTSGEVILSRPIKNDIAFVFQDAHLLPWRNVLRNVALPLELMGVSRQKRLSAARAALEQVGLADAISRYPAQLSGGMKMRVSLARALVVQPRVLLLDEPFAALDEITRQALDEQLRQLWQRHRMTVMFVTHSTVEAAFLADRAIILTRRPARTMLDMPIDLPPLRNGPLRSTGKFAQVQHAMYEALVKGGA